MQRKAEMAKVRVQASEMQIHSSLIQLHGIVGSAIPYDVVSKEASGYLTVDVDARYLRPPSSKLSRYLLDFQNSLVLAGIRFSIA